MFGLSLFRPSRQSNISTSGEERFKYPLPRENKISQMPYPRDNRDNQIPTPCPASPPAGFTLIGALRQRWPRDHYFSRHLFRLTAVTVCQQTTRKQTHFNAYFFHRFIIMELISRLTTQAFTTLKVGKLNVFKKCQKISANVIVRVTAVSLNICCSTNYERCCSLFDK